MRRIKFRTAATRDLRQIARQTRDRWGADQAGGYADALRRDIKILAKFALRFPEHEGSGLGFRKLRSGHHMIFYLVREREIEIVRVLHERMDSSLRLGGLSPAAR